MIKNFNKQIFKPIINKITYFPNNNAFCINEVFYTYKELGIYISKARLSLKETGKEDIYIGLVVNDDIETYASILAIWLEDKAYIPLHPKQPLHRNEEIISQMSIKTVLDSSINSLYNNYYVINTKNLSYTYDLLGYQGKANENTLAYILFTSGSTGKPKGVMISRKNIGAFMDSFWDTGIVINDDDKCLQSFDLTFDVSVQSFLVPLTKGACVYTIPHDQIKYSYVFGLLEDQHITFGAMAPSMLRFLRPYFNELNFPNMKACIVTAEASPLDLILNWQKCIPNADIYDFYGPTEVTIYCTYYKLKKHHNKTLNGMLSIGKPLKNIEAIIIDLNNNILPQGEKGELCLSGNQVTSGYWNNSKKNKKSFIEIEFKGKKRRFYRTGDLCYFESDGNLMLHGRKDSQVKIQGYRVELGEIEFHAREFLKEINTVVIPFINKSSNTELAIFIESKSIDLNKLINYLKSKLPSYMIPTKIILEKTFPVNSSDKVDKTKLKSKL